MVVLVVRVTTGVDVTTASAGKVMVAAFVVVGTFSTLLDPF